MSAALRTRLELVRAPNVFTAVADVVAGFLYTGGSAESWPDLLLLAGASACLYCGGMALNDVCDAFRDARVRPDRPIPSGRLARREALLLGVALLTAGCLLAAGANARSGGVAVLLVVAIVLYDGILKETAAAPVVMGSCRALNLTLGMSAAPLAWTPASAAPIALMGLYVTSLTLFARREAAVSGRVPLALGTIGVCLGVAGQVSLLWLVPAVHEGYLGAVAVLLILVCARGFRAVARPEPLPVQRCVRTFVLSIIMFDTCLAWAARGPVAGLLVLALLAPAILLARRFEVT